MPTPKWQLGLMLRRGGSPYAALWVRVGPPVEFEETGDIRWHRGNVVMDGPDTPVVFETTDIELLPVFRTSVPLSGHKTVTSLTATTSCPRPTSLLRLIASANTLKGSQERGG